MEYTGTEKGILMQFERLGYLTQLSDPNGIGIQAGKQICTIMHDGSEKDYDIMLLRCSLDNTDPGELEQSFDGDIWAYLSDCVIE